MSISGFWGATFIVICFIGLQFFSSIALYDLGFRFEAGDPTFSGVIILFSGAVIISLLARYNRISCKKLFHESETTVKATVALLIIPIVLTSVGSVFLVSDITNVFFLFFPFDIDEYLMMDRLLSGGWVSFIVVCLLAPIVEELMYRGLILRGFLKHYSDNTSIALSAMLFALAHMTLIQLAGAYVVGIVLGWLYVKTKSLWPSILFHGFYNLCVMLIWSHNGEDINKEMILEFNPMGVTILSIGAFILGLYMLRLLLVPKTVVRQ